MTRFFHENKTEVFEIEADGNQFEILESMRIYIERDGRSYNYLSSVNKLNKERESHLQTEESDWRAENHKMDEEAKQKAQDECDRLEALAAGRLDAIEKHVKEVKACNQLHMRQFLMKAIIPVLTEGMIDVCKISPTDPVDYLAEYIFKKSNEVRCPKKN